jgi:SAM-dependent methyltransferase
MANAMEARSFSWFRRAKKASEFLYYSMLRFVRGLAGLHTALSTPDRRVLDGVILKALAADQQYGRVIFVGCDWYTRHYEDMFPGRDYWTIEVDPARARFGAAQHVVGPMVEIGVRFPPASVDLVICNGVIGWGLNDPAEIDASLAACAKALRPGGVLLIGWNDIPEKKVVDIATVPALREFRPFAVAGQSEFRTETYNRHTFSLYQKGEDRGGAARG